MAKKINLKQEEKKESMNCGDDCAQKIYQNGVCVGCMKCQMPKTTCVGYGKQSNDQNCCSGAFDSLDNNTCRLSKTIIPTTTKQW